jgi:hypothetical protein
MRHSVSLTRPESKNSWADANTSVLQPNEQMSLVPTSASRRRRRGSETRAFSAALPFMFIRPNILGPEGERILLDLRPGQSRPLPRKFQVPSQTDHQLESRELSLPPPGSKSSYMIKTLNRAGELRGESISGRRCIGIYTCLYLPTLAIGPLPHLHLRKSPMCSETRSSSSVNAHPASRPSGTRTRPTRSWS